VATINLNDSLPAAPTGTTNCKWQADAPADTVLRNISVYMPLMVGDSGSGGTSGAVPKPASGDAAANKYLKANGTWAVVSSITLKTNSTNNGSQAILNLVAGTNITLSDNGTGSITITAASVSAPAYVREAPIGSLNGSNTSFTLTYTPSPIASLTLWLNGVEQIPGTDYTISSATITYTTAPKSADLHVAQYTH
jgi:hypothetical protein